jgi:enterochelin esterase-like enzyme
MSEIIHRFKSSHTQNERTIWIRRPLDPSKACNLIIFLDGELYRDRVGAVTLLTALEAASDLPNTLVVFVSYHSEAARWIECPCHPPFADFINTELLPWLERYYPMLKHGKERVIAGLSYTGLAAAFTAMRSPDSFTKVIAQSGSFWSDDCWLVGQYENMTGKLPADFYLDVGTREVQENVRHKEDVLQVVSQIDGVRKFRDVLISKKHRVRYREFDGGHDFAAWRETLPDALRWALRHANTVAP